MTYSDEIFMRRAICLALLADPLSVRPNPHVGAVLVYDDGSGHSRIIGEGYHKKRGEGHAEVDCIRSIAPEDRGLIPSATMYVTLEPCAHIGLTPSCAQMLVEQRVGRVVVGTLDPNPLVAGRGVEMLRSQGIDVTVGCLGEECREVAKVFLTHQERSRPYITLKWAQSRNKYLDLCRTDGAPVILSSPFTSMLMHRERSRHAAIVVGGRTLLLDHSRLSNRLWSGQSPMPFVIDLSGQTFELLSSYEDAERWTVVTSSKIGYEVDKYPFEALVVQDENRVLDELMTYLSQRVLTSLLVEGGYHTLSSFIRQDLWDEARVETAPFEILGEGIPAPRLDKGHLTCRDVVDDRIIEWYQNDR